MEKIITLINNIEYDKKFLERKDKEGNLSYRDGDSYTTNIMSLERYTYTSEDFIDSTDELIKISDEITSNFKDTFINRGKPATEEQLYFATETTKVILGDFKKDIIGVIPAPCGFGKSTIKLETMKYLTKQYENKMMTNGVIIVGDRLSDLKELQKDLGRYSKYTFLLESWNEDVCLNKSIKFAESKMCKKCDIKNCKINYQQIEQFKYPILLITNARLKEFGQSINQYKNYSLGERKILLIDERPQILETIKVNNALLNEIDTHISDLTYEDMKEKTELLKEWKQIKELIDNKMTPLRLKYKRFIISNSSNMSICKDNKEFMALWNKYMKYDYGKELDHIHTILTKGGFYVCENNKEFISTIGARNLRENYKDFKTIIFDGSALYDPQYLSMYDENEEKSDLKFLYIPNSRTYENLSVIAYTNHKISKTEFKNKKYLIKAISEFIKNKSKVGIGYDYVVTYNEQAYKLGDLLGNSLKSRVPKMKDGKCYYFGNTKGSNEMEKCTRMFQLGWDTMPDYEYVIMWLSCTRIWDKMLEACLDMDKAIDCSEMLQKMDRDEETRGKRTYSSGHKNYCFGFSDIDRFQYLDTVSKFYQELHRIKLRDYSYEGNLKVYLFQTKHLIFDMVESLLPRCNITFNNDTLSEFQRAKDDNRENKVKGYNEFFDWYKGWDGSLIKAKDIKSICNLDNEQFKTLYKNKTINETISKLDKPKRGYYSK